MVKKVARECFANECFLRTLHNFQIYACCRHCDNYLPTFTVSSLNFPVRFISFRKESKQETLLKKNRISAALKERFCADPCASSLQKNGDFSIRHSCMPQLNISALSRLLWAKIFEERSSTQVIGGKLSGWKPEILRQNFLKTQFSLVHTPTTAGGGETTMASKRSQSEGVREQETQQHLVDAGAGFANGELTAKRFHGNVPKSSSCDEVSSLQSSSSSSNSAMWKASYRAKGLAVSSGLLDTRSRGDYTARASSSNDVSRWPSSDDTKTPAVWRLSYRERVLLHRPWQLTELGELYEKGRHHSKSKIPSMQFTIASYNVLSQNLLEDNSYLYGYCSEKVLDWQFRREHLLAEVMLRQPDILCCQEINEYHFQDFFQSAFKDLGYEGEFKKRTRNMRDGCATFFKTSMFECVSVVPVEYLKPGVSVLDRDNVALVVLLRPKQAPNTSTRLCVANTHLLFNPRRGDVKLAQLMVLFAEIDKLTFLREQQTPSGTVPVYHPIIFCGDLNLQPFSQLYRFVSSGTLPLNGVTIRKLSGQETKANTRSGTDNRITNSFLDRRLGITDSSQYVETCRQRSNGTCDPIEIVGDETCDYTQGGGTLTHKLGFRSAYRHYTDFGSRYYEHRVPEVSTCHGHANCTVDYIFYSSGTVGAADEMWLDGSRSSKSSSQHNGDKLLLLSRLSLLSDREMYALGGLPNEIISSDHLMLSAKFALKVDE